MIFADLVGIVAAIVATQIKHLGLSIEIEFFFIDDITLTHSPYIKLKQFHICLTHDRGWEKYFWVYMCDGVYGQNFVFASGMFPVFENCLKATHSCVNQTWNIATNKFSNKKNAIVKRPKNFFMTTYFTNAIRNIEYICAIYGLYNYCLFWFFFTT